MNFHRRQFLGGAIAGYAGLAAPRTFAVAKAAERPALLPQALAALDRHSSRVIRRDTIGIVDFSLHSREQRFHLIDVASGRVAASYLVAHGRGSDPANSGWVQHFSNRPGSNASSEGSFLVDDTYHGKHGLSRRIRGLDPENSLAFERAIVIHGASYVDSTLVHSQGRIGRSLGCFAVQRKTIGEVIERLGPGRLLFAAK